MDEHVPVLGEVRYDRGSRPVAPDPPHLVPELRWIVPLPGPIVAAPGANHNRIPV
mgnify:CR=1 FL=1